MKLFLISSHYIYLISVFSYVLTVSELLTFMSWMNSFFFSIPSNKSLKSCGFCYLKKLFLYSMFYIWFNFFWLYLFEVDLHLRFNSWIVLNFDWRTLNCSICFLVFMLFCFKWWVREVCYCFCFSLFFSLLLSAFSFLGLLSSDCVFIIISLKTGFPDGESVCLGFYLPCLLLSLIDSSFNILSGALSYIIIPK